MTSVEPQNGPVNDACSGGPPDSEPRWWVRDIVIATIVGTLLAAGSIWGQNLIDDSRAIRDEAKQKAQARHDEQLGNLVFVRQLSSADPEQARPFSYMDLEGMALVGLELPGADFAYANLTDTRMMETDFTGADFSATTLVNADLAYADLTNARLSGDRFATDDGARHVGADLTHATLLGTNLTGADLSGANLTDIYYDESTRWPVGFQPPPSRE